MNFRISHSTQYTYSEPVSLCRNEACLLIRDTPWQRCSRSELQIEPLASDVRHRQDLFGNRISHFSIQHPHNKLTVTAVSDVSVCTNPNILASANQFPWETTKARLNTQRTPDIFDALPFLYDSPFAQRSGQLETYAMPSFLAGRPMGEAVFDLMQRIYRDFKYDPGFTTISTPLSKVLSDRRGVCQDFAHLGVACLRSMGLAARYVSGYIETLPPSGQERLVGADASHAWFSVYVADLGWVDFDPTNNKLLSDQHVTVAWGRDFSDVSPLRGVALGGGKHKVSVSVDVARQPDNGSC